MKMIILTACVLVAGFVSTASADLVVVSGNVAFLDTYGGARFRSLANTGGSEIFVGIPDLGVQGNRDERNATWATGDNQITITLDTINDLLTAEVSNANGVFSLTYNNLLANASSIAGAGGSLADVNAFQLTVASRDANSDANLLNVVANGDSAGDFTADGFNDFTIGGLDATNGVVLTGNIQLSGNFSNSQEKSRIEFRFGRVQAIPEPLTAFPVACLAGFGMLFSRRRKANAA